MLIRNVRLVPVGGGRVPYTPVDIRLNDDEIVGVGPSFPRIANEEEFDAQGRWAIPGLWDQHVHMSQWAQTSLRIDLSGTSSPEEVCARVRAHLDTLDPEDPNAIIVGFGYRSPEWSRLPTTAELDAVSATHPVVLISGDAHNGWLNTQALNLFAVPYQDGPLDENEWFRVFAQMSAIPQLVQQTEQAYRAAVRRASSQGVVGIVDLEFELGYVQWARRYASGITSLRVRTAVYEDNLDPVIAAGLQSGMELVGTEGMVQMGPLKIIADGSLNTRTAYCCEPYINGGLPGEPRGRLNQTSQHLRELMTRAHRAGLVVAVHAIGDAALTDALDAFEFSGARGTIEHAQLVRREDVNRMAALGVKASVQPAHLLDDRDAALHLWGDRQDRCFPVASLLNAGVPLLLGSDAPIAPLDPWLAMAAAVHRTGDDRAPWNPGESLTAEQALAASTDRQSTLQSGSRPDVVLLDADPLAVSPDDTAAVATHLRSIPVAATIVDGEFTHYNLT